MCHLGATKQKAIVISRQERLTPWPDAPARHDVLAGASGEWEEVRGRSEILSESVARWFQVVRFCPMRTIHHQALAENRRSTGSRGRAPRRVPIRQGIIAVSLSCRARHERLTAIFTDFSWLAAFGW
jgi:hypothetical protein